MIYQPTLLPLMENSEQIYTEIIYDKQSSRYLLLGFIGEHARENMEKMHSKLLFWPTEHRFPGIQSLYS